MRAGRSGRQSARHSPRHPTDRKEPVMKNVVLAAVAWLAGTMFSGALASAPHLPLPSFPQNASPAEGFAWFVLASLLLAAGTAPAAGRLPRGVQRPRTARSGT